MPTKDEEFKNLNISLNGRLRTSVDGTQLGEGDFQILKNMRYGDLSPRSISGMTILNSAAPTYTKFKRGFHFRKSQPQESHTLIQAMNDALTGEVIYDNTHAIPSSGNFETTLIYSDLP